MTTIPGQTSELQQIVELLLKESRWYVICHVKPDGDTLGCGSALMCAASLLGKSAVWGGADPLPPLYSFLPFAEKYCTGEQSVDGALVVAVDVSTADRGIPGVCADICIDHHHDNEGFAKHANWVEPQAAASGELIYELIRMLGCPITPDIAKALYVSLATDCGWFRFSNTTANTLRVASELVAAGARPHEIDELLDYSDSLAKIRLWGHCLSRAKAVGQSSVLSWLSSEDFRQTGAAESDTEGLVNMLTHVSGTDMTVFVSETDKGLRCSFRSRGKKAANELAAMWDGGGHIYAAGCTITKPLAEGLAEVEEVLARV